jgi:acyl-coenzyme A synthetase/AMP-(fatty) acid ligase
MRVRRRGAAEKATFDAWQAATGIKILDGIGATEMLHIFIGSPEHELRPGATGKPVPGYEARVIDSDGNEVAPGTIGRLAVRGPTGCRYLADKRQRQYVQDGWNVTGDTYLMDDDGYFWYQARSDDMIVSAGYNIAGPQVDPLLAHPAVAECGWWERPTRSAARSSRPWCCGRVRPAMPPRPRCSRTTSKRRSPHTNIRAPSNM